MDQPDFFRPVAHPTDEIDQIIAIGVGRITADRMDSRPNGLLAAIEKDVALRRGILLDYPAGSPLGLVPDEEDVCSGIADKGLEVIDDSAAAAHAAGGNDYTGDLSFLDMVYGRKMILMTVHRGQLLKRQGMAATL